MAKELVIGLWTFDAGDLFGDGRTSWTKSIQERVGGLRSAAERLQQEAARSVDSPGFNSILAAPEYLFSNRDADGARLPLSESERLELEPRLLELSRAFPRMVMVPGTLFYAKTLVRPSGADMKFNPATGLRDLPKTGTAERREKYVRKVGAALAEADQLFADLQERDSVKSHGFVVGRNDYAVPALSTLQETLRNGSKTPLVVRNTAYLLHGGRRVGKYDKRADFGETRGAAADDLAFVPGTTQQCPVIDGYRFGVEICYDHQVGALARRGVPDLRFHILVSDATDNKRGSMAMSEGGYFLHASTIGSETTVLFRKPGGRIEAVQETDDPPIFSVDELKLYRTTVPD